MFLVWDTIPIRIFGQQLLQISDLLLLNVKVSEHAIIPNNQVLVLLSQRIDLLVVCLQLLRSRHRNGTLPHLRLQL
jgi:hypothetical protein